jgi:N-sulfoglucosamine sulfohydrolase
MIVFGIALFGLLPAGSALAKPPQPNLVIFLADDLGLVECPPYSAPAGPSTAHAPTMQRLAREGLTFTHAFVASPSCAPSRASLLTGLHIARHGAVNNHDKPRPDVKKWPAYLRDLGYEVVSFGKIAHGKHTPLYGFDSFHQPSNDMKAVVGFLRGRTGSNLKPLCLMVGTHWPHVPWPDEPRGYDPATLKLPPTMIDTPEARIGYARYLTAATLADADLGTVYDAVWEHLGNNTLFVFSSDHGPQLPLAKWNCYDAGIRVPMIAVWPGVTRPGARTDAMVSWLDLLPTFIEAGGGTPPPVGLEPGQIDGRSFLRVLRGQADSHRNLIFTAHNRDGEMNFYPIRGVRSARWSYVRNLIPNARHTTHLDKLPDRHAQGAYWPSWLTAATTDGRAAALLDRYHTRPAEELYDLEADPYEQRNLAAYAAHGRRLAQMRSAVDEWMTQMGDGATTAKTGQP